MKKPNHPNHTSSMKVADSRFRQSVLAMTVTAALSAHAQITPEPADKKDAQKLKPVLVQEQAEKELGKDSIRAVNTTPVRATNRFVTFHNQLQL